MKRCPECRRDYYDDTLLYCLDDGSGLLEGPSSVDEPATAILPAGIGSQSRPPAQRISTDKAPVLPAANVTKSTSFDKRRLALPFLLAIIVLGGFFAYRYYRPASSKQIETIAVMPFVNESGNPDVEYLSDGMSETLINSLSQIPNLSVKAQSAVFRYKGKEFDPKRIASELNVQAILTGRVVQLGDQIALNLELIDVHTENVLWGNKYERQLADLASVQSEIAKNLSEILRSKLSYENLQKVTKSYTQNTDAYQAYLTGKFFYRQTKGDSSIKANEYYQKAIKADPNFALAWVALSQTYSGTEITKIMSRGEAGQKRAFALRKALELDPNLSEAHALNGWNIFNEWDFGGAEEELKLAIELDPNSSQSHYRYSWLLATYGKFDTAVAECKKAQELDPFDPLINTLLGAWLVKAKRYDEALAQLTHTLEINPDFDQAHDWMAVLFAYTGKYEEGLAEMDKLQELAKDKSELRKDLLYIAHLETVGYIKSLTGDKTPAEKALTELSQRYEEKGGVQETELAVLSVAIGDKDQAFEWLEKGFQKRSGYMKFLKALPFLDSLQDDPRFVGLLKRMGLPE